MHGKKDGGNEYLCPLTVVCVYQCSLLYGTQYDNSVSQKNFNQCFH